MKHSLVEKTKNVIESISKMESIKPYILVGGTALSLQIENRLSEDLDFMRWQSHRKEKMDIDIKQISAELKANHQLQKTDILESNHIEFYIDEGVKLSFYAPERPAPLIKTIPYMNKLYLADIDTIAALKLETMQRRSLFRDYYDLYCILKDKDDNEIVAIIDNALRYSGHAMRSKNLLGKLCNYERFDNDNELKSLAPKFNITAKQIAVFMSERVRAAYLNRE